MNRVPVLRSLRAAAIITAALLLIPLVAMRLSPEMRWGPGDFLAAAVLLFVAVSAASMALYHFRSVAARALAVGAIILVFGLVWAELAVGLFR